MYDAFCRLSPNALFNVSSYSGNVFLAFNGVLDYEIAHSHTLQYQVFDSGLPQLNSTVRELIISINDINDNTPIIGTVNQQVSVREDIPLGTLIFTITATDADSGINNVLRFQIISIDPYFTIDDISGEITLSQHLDYEHLDFHILQIRVYDLGSPQLNAYTNFTVIVLDRNDNTPVFFPVSYNPSILENPTTDFFVVEVSATDNDSGEHMNLEFTLTDDPLDPGLFTINKTSGTTAEIRVSGASILDRERQASYLLFVNATDNRNLPIGGVPDRDTIVNTIRAEVSM